MESQKKEGCGRGRFVGMPPCVAQSEVRHVITPGMSTTLGAIAIS